MSSSKSVDMLRFKPSFIGGTSDAVDIPQLVEFLKIFNPKSILDIGTGCFGKIGYIARQYVEHKYRHLYGTNSLWITGVEAFKPNADYLRGLYIYDEIFNDEAIRFLSVPPTDVEFEVVTCTHVLEHHTKDDAWTLLSLMYAKAKKGVILACPYGEYEHTNSENHYQNHLSSWTPEEISEKYPITTPIMSRNNIGKEEFLIVIPKR